MSVVFVIAGGDAHVCDFAAVAVDGKTARVIVFSKVPSPLLM